jgi:hypothetical protein
MLTAVDSSAPAPAPVAPAADPVAEATMFVAQHRGNGGELDVAGLAADMRSAATPELVSALEAQMTPVERGQFAAALGGGGGGGGGGDADAPVTASSEGIGSFVDGFVRGDFAGNDSWSALAGQVVAGFIPVVGQIADVRDAAAAVGGIVSGRDGAWADLGLAALGFVPGIGDAAKGAVRGGAQVVDAGGEIAQQVARRGDDIATAAARGADDVATGAARSADEAAAVVRTGRVGQNEVRWTLDAEGRPVHAEATLHEVHDGTPRSSAEQRAQRETGHAGNPGDQGGHIIGHRFMPDQGSVNMFPQAGEFNNGAYRLMENEWADWIKAGADVRVDVDLSEFHGARPDRVNVSYQVHDQSGNLIYEGGERFRNEAGQQFDRVPRADIEAMLAN